MLDYFFDFLLIPLKNRVEKVHLPLLAAPRVPHSSIFPLHGATYKKPRTLSFTVIRKYLQQLIINADKQGASKSREYITFISGRFSAFLLRNKTPFLRTDMENPYPVISMLTKPHKSRTE